MHLFSRSYNRSDELAFEAGFSLVEVLVAVGAGSIAALILAQAMLNNQKSINQQDARIAFMFPKLLVQQTIRDNPNVICPELGFQSNPMASPSPAVVAPPVPTSSEVQSMLASAPNPTPTTPVELYFLPRVVPQGAATLGLIATSSPGNFIPQMGFNKNVFQCSPESATSEKCRTELLFSVRARAGYTGQLPPADRIPLDLIVSTDPAQNRKLLSCRFGNPARTPTESPTPAAPPTATAPSPTLSQICASLGGKFNAQNTPPCALPFQPDNSKRCVYNPPYNRVECGAPGTECVFNPTTNRVVCGAPGESCIYNPPYNRVECKPAGQSCVYNPAYNRVECL